MEREKTGRYPWESKREGTVRNHYYEYLNRFRADDIIERAEKMGIELDKEKDEEFIQILVLDLEKLLSNNDAYMEAYWKSVEEAIRNRRSKEHAE
jgi:hypothetical protein